MILAMSQFEMAVVFFCCVLFLLFVIWLIWQSAADGPNDKKPESIKPEERTVAESREIVPTPTPTTQQSSVPEFKSTGRVILRRFLWVVFWLGILAPFTGMSVNNFSTARQIEYAFNDSIWKEIALHTAQIAGGMADLILLGLCLLIALSYIEQHLAHMLFIMRLKRRN